MLRIIALYLQLLFGKGARANVAFEDGQFNGIALARPNYPAALPFDTLSGGAREQVAAATRLAMAELLATGHPTFRS